MAFFRKNQTEMQGPKHFSVTSIGGPTSINDRPHPKHEPLVTVSASWLAYVDSVASLIVHRGYDEQACRDLARISDDARKLAS